MSASYVVADLVRNPRRTASSMIGVVLGVGLFCGVLFLVDGLSASMTQRALAPLAIDMQRIVTQPAGTALELTQTIAPAEDDPNRFVVTLAVSNPSQTDAHEVTVRSIPDERHHYVDGSAAIEAEPLVGVAGNPLAQGAARAGLNIGTLAAGESVRLTYLVTTQGDAATDDSSVRSSYSTREAVQPVGADQPPPVEVDELARRISVLPGIAHAAPLSIAELGTNSLHAKDATTIGPAKLFGFDDAYTARDSTITIVQGTLSNDGAVISAEAADTLSLSLGDTITFDLPDATIVALPVTGIADLSRSRALFSSRRGGDLETFIYVPNSVIVSPAVFAQQMLPAFERAAAENRGGRLKTPPIREVDITVERDLLDANPLGAVDQTEQIATDVMALAAHQDYLLDNITNTLHVAAADAAVAKRLFVFLGVPGALLAAMLAAYAGNVMAEAQRREQAILRIRGASRRHLLRMLALRTTLLTGAGASLGLVAGYGVALAVLGRATLQRASPASLAASSAIGTFAGFVATGAALYLTGRRSIDREINEDRSQFTSRAPLWRRARLDVAGLSIIVAGTVWAVAADAFAGAAGSVYYGRAVQLNLALLVLPVAVWIAGSLLAARLIGAALGRARPHSSPTLGPAAPALLRRSIGRRPWPISNAAIIAALIVALATSLAAFTASYDNAKVNDARYANGADIRITPSPTAERTYGVHDAGVFLTSSITRTTPVIYGPSNVILRSARTSDPANLAAIDPASYSGIAPLDPVTAVQIRTLAANPDTILVSRDMAASLRARPGDSLEVLLARATPEQVAPRPDHRRLVRPPPGFPDGADAVMNIEQHTRTIPTKAPEFFLASHTGNGEEALRQAVAELAAGPAALDTIQIDTRATTLDRDQSSLAALNVAGLVELDSGFSLAMAAVAVAIFVFGLLLQRRREYVTLRAQGLNCRTIRFLITAEAATAAVTGTIAGLAIGAAMGYYFVAVLRPLFVLDPAYVLPLGAIAPPVLLVAVATLASAFVGSRLVNSLEPTELLRDE